MSCRESNDADLNEAVLDTVEYHNPVVTGFHPDPSVVCVDGIFYMATSTFQYFPGIPIYASTNLREWQLIGHAINRTEQLSLFYAHSRLIHLENGNKMIATGGLQAPTIRHHKGTFYVVGSNMVRRDGVMSREQFIVSTQDIWHGDWSDPITFDFHGFDTSIFVDDDERVYIQGAWATDRRKQPHTLIHQLELDLETGQILSPSRLIWGGHSNFDTEGPHIYKKDGWYYLVAAEGGTFEHHMLTIARARDIWGPFQTYEQNPILTADGEDAFIQGLGHGELFQDSDGAWWAIALGFRSLDGVWPIGREPFLSKVEWPEGGWPAIQQPSMTFVAKRVSEVAQMPSVEAVSELIHLRGRERSSYQIPNPHGLGTIRLLPTCCTIDSLRGLPTFVGKRQQELSATARVTLDLDLVLRSADHVQAGLAVYLDPVRYVSLTYNFTTSTVIFKLLLPGTQTYKETSYAIDPQDATMLQFKVEAHPTFYSFFYALQHGPDGNEGAWLEAGTATTRDLFVRFFTGPVFGIFAQSERAWGDGTVPWVTFRDFDVSSTAQRVLSGPRIRPKAVSTGVLAESGFHLTADSS
ncbi:hypothetical protein NLU13_0272 [Sarocladium strictum]|uniref:Beta-xylosidase C-terminal Concanavalin A-like domain-containing protein n=1 Tax=Sarocladium strictum TaxID=5046 RepID=A0AA39LBC7_SARSR|nr:hypothetical protein NLU13_0272 [Sarocladium strictum]